MLSLVWIIYIRSRTELASLFHLHFQSFSTPKLFDEKKFPKHVRRQTVPFTAAPNGCPGQRSSRFRGTLEKQDFGASTRRIQVTIRKFVFEPARTDGRFTREQVFKGHRK
ncbi:hypothetical protein BB8028_0003g14370 [Beauveria bassiana]|uniref:Uncharacterized protein n=1 Tax=Beauveria bassiana TaxID=176275 RepID=A0A2S7YAE9_BEABA|nr:hypothetical protein BB8028_0003g14370 [Beauveria bassiana]